MAPSAEDKGLGLALLGGVLAVHEMRPLLFLQEGKRERVGKCPVAVACPSVEKYEQRHACRTRTLLVRAILREQNFLY